METGHALFSELMVINPGSDIRSTLEHELAALGASDWTSYHRPSRVTHPSLQVARARKTTFQLVLLDLAAEVAGRPQLDVMRSSAMPQWFVDDVIERLGKDALILILVPKEYLNSVAVACKRVARAKHRIVPLIRDPDYWTA